MRRKRRIIYWLVMLLIAVSCSPSNTKDQSQKNTIEEMTLDSLDREAIDSLERFQDRALNDLKNSTDVVLICGDSMLTLFEKVENGNLEALKTFIENGGDPMFECYNRTLPGRRLSRLVTRINLSNSYKMLKYYLQQNITAEWKEILLKYQTTNRNDKSVRLLIKNDAREEFDINSCIPLEMGRYNYLLQNGYEVNYIRPEDSTTDLMHYAECPCPNGADEIIESMKFLVKNGADHTIETSSGKKAIDFATHPDIIAYLSSL